jgi:hypothetical protein
MNITAKETAISELMTIPSVGPSIANDLWNIGIRRINDLKGADPNDLWLRISAHQGQTVCRCVLYTMRCAVYYASHKRHDPELLKWWNHKD